MFTWSGALQQAGCRSWTVIRNGRECALGAFALQRCRYFGGTTDIGAAIEHALRMFEASPYHSFYRVVLLLTNGRTDRGSEARLERARRTAAELGITLVGHALVPKRSGWASGRGPVSRTPSTTILGVT